MWGDTMYICKTSHLMQYDILIKKLQW